MFACMHYRRIQSTLTRAESAPAAQDRQPGHPEKTKIMARGFLTTHLNPMWHVDVSIGSACRAAGRQLVAVVRRAEMRAALQHLAGNFAVGLVGVVARVFAAAARVLGDAAG